MSRRQPPVVVERYSFGDGTQASVVTRASAKRLRSMVHGNTAGTYRFAVIPTRAGFVRVQGWPKGTRYTLILNGAVYTREDAYGVSEKSLPITAGIFAKKMAELDAAWRAAGGQP